MRVDLKNMLTKEQMDEFNNSPKILRLDYLSKRVREGAATPEEKQEWEEKTGWVRKLPKNVLSESHRPTAV